MFIRYHCFHLSVLFCWFVTVIIINSRVHVHRRKCQNYSIQRDSHRWTMSTADFCQRGFHDKSCSEHRFAQRWLHKQKKPYGSLQSTTVSEVEARLMVKMGLPSKLNLVDVVPYNVNVISIYNWYAAKLKTCGVRIQGNDFQQCLFANTNLHLDVDQT